MFKFGLEKEYFIYNSNKELVLVDTNIFPYDECGYLVEARGKAFDSIREAVYSLLAEQSRLYKLAKENNYILTDEPVKVISRKLKVKAARRFNKGTISYQNLYGYEHHRNKLNEVCAGVHLSITNPTTVYFQNGKETYNKETYGVFDFPQIFRKLDLAFKEEIKLAKRNPGFYEIKSDGRIEYRSLPANVDLEKLISIVENEENNDEDDE